MNWGSPIWYIYIYILRICMCSKTKIILPCNVGQDGTELVRDDMVLELDDMQALGDKELERMQLADDTEVPLKVRILGVL